MSISDSKPSTVTSPVDSWHRAAEKPTFFCFIYKSFILEKQLHSPHHIRLIPDAHQVMCQKYIRYVVKAAVPTAKLKLPS